MKTAKILVMADEEVPAYWEYYKPGIFDGIDLIISCGDLPAKYLSFIATMSNLDVLYVHGNHDHRYEDNPPLGCIDIDGKIYNWRGLKILGLGGSFRYKPGPYQYTEKEMKQRVRRLFWKLYFAKKIDILVCHSPARNINDGNDLPHRGFETFVDILDRWKPAWFIHGHVHMNYGNYPRLDTYKDTQIVNAYQRFVIEVPLPEEK